MIFDLIERSFYLPPKMIFLHLSPKRTAEKQISGKMNSRGHTENPGF